MEVTELLYLLERSRAVKAHNNPEDPWEELLDLAMHDPCVRQAVDMVRFRGMSVVDAALHLALAQTKCVAILREELVKARMHSTFPVMISATWVTDKVADKTQHSGD